MSFSCPDRLFYILVDQELLPGAAHGNLSRLQHIDAEGAFHSLFIHLLERDSGGEVQAVCIERVVGNGAVLIPSVLFCSLYPEIFEIYQQKNNVAAS